jgi:hypothetical protein
MVQVKDNVHALALTVLNMLERGEVDAAKLALREVLDDIGERPHEEQQDRSDAAVRLANYLPGIMLGAGVLEQPPHSAGVRWPVGTVRQVPQFVNPLFSAVVRTSAASSYSALSSLRIAFQDPENYLKPVQEMIVRCSYRPELRAIEQFNDRMIVECGVVSSWTAESRSRAIEDSEKIIAWLLRAQSARESISDKIWKRLLLLASEAGMTQRQIAHAVKKNQTYVNRQLKLIDEDPRVVRLSPRELYDHYLGGELDRNGLLTALAAYPYEQGSFPKESPEWGYLPGSMDELTSLVLEGALSQEEFELVLAGIDALKAATNGI